MLPSACPVAGFQAKTDRLQCPEEVTQGGATGSQPARDREPHAISLLETALEHVSLPACNWGQVCDSSFIYPIPLPTAWLPLL